MVDRFLSLADALCIKQWLGQIFPGFYFQILGRWVGGGGGGGGVGENKRRKKYIFFHFQFFFFFFFFFNISRANC